MRARSIWVQTVSAALGSGLIFLAAGWRAYGQLDTPLIVLNLAYTQVQFLSDSLSNSPPAQSNWVSVLQPNTATSSGQLQNVAGAATSEISFPLISSTALQVNGHIACNVTMTSMPGTISAGIAAGTAYFGAAWRPSNATPYSLSFSTTLPPAVNVQSNDLFTNFLYVNASSSFYAVNGNTYLFQTNLVGNGTSTSFVTNDIVPAGSNLITAASSILEASLFQSSLQTNGIAGSLSNEADFSLTLTLAPWLAISNPPSHLMLFWPTNFGTYTAQSSTNLANAGGWTNIPNMIVISNGYSVLTIPFGGGKQVFYRLKK